MGVLRPGLLFAKSPEPGGRLQRQPQVCLRGPSHALWARICSVWPQCRYSRCCSSRSSSSPTRSAKEKDRDNSLGWSSFLLAKFNF